MAIHPQVGQDGQDFGHFRKALYMIFFLQTFCK
jgi:hypothetical protein